MNDLILEWLSQKAVSCLPFAVPLLVILPLNYYCFWRLHTVRFDKT